MKMTQSRVCHENRFFGCFFSSESYYPYCLSLRFSDLSLRSITGLIMIYGSEDPQLRTLLCGILQLLLCLFDPRAKFIRSKCFTLDS